MRAFVITLDRCSDKFIRITKRLNQLGFETTAIDGITPPQNYAHLFDSNSFLQKYGRVPARGEVGCALSHLKAYRNLLEEKLDSAFIFEDDAILLDSFASLLNSDRTGWLQFGAVSFYSESAFALSAKTTCDVVPKLTSFMCDNTLAYWITADGAQKLLDSRVCNERISGLADWPLPPESFRLGLLTDEVYAIHDSNSSSIEASRHRQRRSIWWRPGKLRRSLTFWWYRIFLRAKWTHHSSLAGRPE